MEDVPLLPVYLAVSGEECVSFTVNILEILFIQSRNGIEARVRHIENQVIKISGSMIS